MSIDLAHVSDVHLGPLPRPNPLQLVGKRGLGYLSWLHHRQRRHCPKILDAVLAELAREPVDHVAVTGDLVNIALPAEFTAGARWLERLGPSARVSLVPGNHDAYGGRSWRRGWRLWAAYMRGDDADSGHRASVSDTAAPREDGAASSDDPSFPWSRRIGDHLLIGASSAVPSPIGHATGRLGEAQLTRLEALLEGDRGPAHARILMIHHAPVRGAFGRRRRLLDEPALRRIIARHGLGLILSGHEHHFHFATIDGRDGEVPVLIAPSASNGASTNTDAADKADAGGYLRYRLDGRGGLLVRRRAWDPADQALRTCWSARLETRGRVLRLVDHAW